MVLNIFMYSNFQMVKNKIINILKQTSIFNILLKDIQNANYLNLLRLNGHLNNNCKLPFHIQNLDLVGGNTDEFTKISLIIISNYNV
jgi:hypothetical protein